MLSMSMLSMCLWTALPGGISWAPKGHFVSDYHKRQGESRFSEGILVNPF